jgi:hypothetical protein
MSLCIYNNVQLYLYSCQDLILESNSLYDIKARGFYRLYINPSEILKIYPTQTPGIMVLNNKMLQECKHNQIIYHKLNDNTILCEVKPFIANDHIYQYLIKDAGIIVVQNVNNVYIYYKGIYYGTIDQECIDIRFDKIEKGSQEYGIIYLGGKKKHIVVFNALQVLYCGQYIDSEILKDYIQIYTHNPNIFNIGTLVKFNFNNQLLSCTSIVDRGDERKQVREEFNIIYFLEAIKCGRYKYAYAKLAYELKSQINIDILSVYFPRFDRYIYINSEDVYIMLCNNKIVGIYHFSIKDNMIYNIY